MDPDLRFALELADLADSITLPLFRRPGLAVETKADLTPVTEADRAVEQALRERIARERPGDSLLGEEYGAVDGGAAHWIVDPIDGTKNFSRGIPIYATLIALERGGEPVLGVASAPALRRRWWAARGQDAFANGEPIRVSAVNALEEAVVSLPHASATGLARRAWHVRDLGDFWQHVLVAEGAVEVAVDPVVSVWDLAAIRPIVEEAGGRFTDVSGAARIDGGSGVSSNGLLHDEALAALAASA